MKNTYIIACHTTISHSIESADSDADDLKIEEGNLFIIKSTMSNKYRGVAVLCMYDFSNLTLENLLLNI